MEPLGHGRGFKTILNEIRGEKIYVQEILTLSKYLFVRTDLALFVRTVLALFVRTDLALFVRTKIFCSSICTKTIYYLISDQIRASRVSMKTLWLGECFKTIWS